MRPYPISTPVVDRTHLQIDPPSSYCGTHAPPWPDRSLYAVLVGDRGMLTGARIREDLKGVDGLRWITTLRAPTIRKLIANGEVAQSMFDERDCYGWSSRRRSLIRPAGAAGGPCRTAVASGADHPTEPRPRRRGPLAERGAWHHGQSWQAAPGESSGRARSRQLSCRSSARNPRTGRFPSRATAAGRSCHSPAVLYYHAPPARSYDWGGGLSVGISGAAGQAQLVYTPARRRWWSGASSRPHLGLAHCTGDYAATGKRSAIIFAMSPSGSVSL